MSEMVERVAKAILEDRKNSSNMFIPSTELCLAMARAAIAAMREPTEAMRDSCGNGECAKWAPGAWQNYIDAALVR